MGIVNINCKHYISKNSGCSCKEVKRQLLGIGPRVCTIVIDRTLKCDHQEFSIKKPLIPPPQPPPRKKSEVKIEITLP